MPHSGPGPESGPEVTNRAAPEVTDPVGHFHVCSTLWVLSLLSHPILMAGWLLWLVGWLPGCVGAWVVVVIVGLGGDWVCGCVALPWSNHPVCYSGLCPNGITQE